jgi:phosphoglycerate dehydrogenase-like enzyme
VPTRAQRWLSALRQEYDRRSIRFLTMGDRFPQAKNEIQVLLLEGVNQSAVELISGSGYTKVTQVPRALNGCVLRDAAQGVHLLGIRSRTHLDDRFFAAADQLMAVGCFGVGTNQVDLSTSTQPAGAAYRCSTRHFQTPAVSASW